MPAKTDDSKPAGAKPANDSNPAGEAKGSSGFRDTAATGIEKAGGALDTFLAATRKGLDSLQQMTNTKDVAAGQALARGLAFAQQNVAEAVEHAQKLVKSGDVNEAVRMQTEYVKEQFSKMKAQAEELTATVTAKKDEPAPGPADAKPTDKA